MFNYEIGGNERRIDASEAFADIAHNKTLFVQKLTDNEAIKPEKVEGLKTVQEVFNHYKPQVQVDFEQYDGAAASETLHFGNLGDFAAKNMVKQSRHLNNVQIEKEMSISVLKQLKSNKTLQTTLGNDETKNAFISALKNFVRELEEND